MEEAVAEEAVAEDAEAIFVVRSSSLPVSMSDNNGMPPKRTTRVLLRAAEHPASSSSSLLRPWASPEEFLPAAESGDDATVASALRNSLVDPT